LEKKKRQMTPVYTFSHLQEGRNLLMRLVREAQLCPKLCFIQTGEGPCEGLRQHTCHGACEQQETSDSYNQRVAMAIASLQKSLPSFALLDDGRHGEEKSCILIEQGRFYGMGYVPADSPIADTDTLKDYLTRYPENDYMRGLVYQYAERWPGKKSYLSALI
ncbi:MAG TPA: DNA polymerase III subunit epsilon, partial [Puia sp.]|nr:DNA polymerase III subunit epsilon [Puia sp.]